LTSKKTGHNRCAGVGGFDSWWMYIVVLAILLLGIYAFLVLIGARTRWVTRHSERTAESMYDTYGDPARARRHSAKGHVSK
jgi:hypothetical protein